MALIPKGAAAASILAANACDLLPPARDGRRWDDYIGAFHFFVELEGMVIACFKSVSGLGVEVEPIEYRAGTDEVARKRPGRAKYNDITLKRGVMTFRQNQLWEWFDKTLKGETERKSGSILLLNDRGNEITRFNFFEAWPSKWKGWEMDASNQTGVLEEVVLTVEKVEKGKIAPDEWLPFALSYLRS